MCFVRLDVGLPTCVDLNNSIDLYVCVCAYVCVCMCVCACMCVCECALVCGLGCYHGLEVRWVIRQRNLRCFSWAVCRTRGAPLFLGRRAGRDRCVLPYTKLSYFININSYRSPWLGKWAQILYFYYCGCLCWMFAVLDLQGLRLLRHPRPRKLM